MKNIAITENHLYKKVYEHGQKYSCEHIVVYVHTDYHARRLMRENPLKQKINRIGLTVTKKIGGAVIRSRVRRIIRAAYQSADKDYNLKKGLLVVLVAKPSIITSKSNEIYLELVHAFKKLGVINTEIIVAEN